MHCMYVYKVELKGPASGSAVSGGWGRSGGREAQVPDERRGLGSGRTRLRRRVEGTSRDRGYYVCFRSARSPRGLWQGH